MQPLADATKRTCVREAEAKGVVIAHCCANWNSDAITDASRLDSEASQRESIDITSAIQYPAILRSCWQVCMQSVIPDLIAMLVQRGNTCVYNIKTGVVTAASAAINDFASASSADGAAAASSLREPALAATPPLIMCVSSSRGELVSKRTDCSECGACKLQVPSWLTVRHR